MCREDVDHLDARSHNLFMGDWVCWCNGAVLQIRNNFINHPRPLVT
jgi:hypothetical protein